MKQIICPKCGIIKSYYKIEHLNRNVFYDVNGTVVDTSDAQVTYEGVLKCPQCNHKVHVVDNVISVLDDLSKDIASREETLEGFLMHPGTVATVLAMIDEYRGEQINEDDLSTD